MSFNPLTFFVSPQILPNSSVNVTLTSECSSMQLSQANFNATLLVQPMVATLNCSVLDPITVEEGLTVVSRAVSLDFPQKETIVYPFELNMVLDLAPTYYRNRRRHLLQQDGPTLYKVCSVVEFVTHLIHQLCTRYAAWLS
jgi:hypothetical protein